MTDDATRPPNAWTPEQVEQALSRYPVMTAMVMSDESCLITLQNDTHQLTLKAGPDWIQGEEIPLRRLPALRVPYS